MRNMIPDSSFCDDWRETYRQARVFVPVHILNDLLNNEDFANESTKSHLLDVWDVINNGPN